MLPLYVVAVVCPLSQVWRLLSGNGDVRIALFFMLKRIMECAKQFLDPMYLAIQIYNPRYTQFIQLEMRRSYVSAALREHVYLTLPASEQENRKLVFICYGPQPAYIGRN